MQKFSILIMGLSFLSIAFFANKILAQVTSQPIHDGWEFRQVGQENWLPAQVPGCVHTDLMAHGQIGDPYYRTNERDLQWIGERDWEYRCQFKIEASLSRKEQVELVFQGLDTYADVFLNEKKILSADNMFRDWRVNVKSMLKPGVNQLRIQFRSVFAENLPKWQQAPFRLLAFPNNDQADVQINMYSRKAGFHYGWDWGPRLITCGIWRPIFLTGWNESRIDAIQVLQNQITRDQARLTAVFEISASTPGNTTIAIQDQNQVLAQKQVKLVKGANQARLDFNIANPKLWWSNGLGTPHLYHFSGLLQKGSKVLDSKAVTTGLRTLRVVRDRDAFGASLHVELNGVPVFMKGANYIPQDNFQNRVTPERYQQIIQSAVAANMNMLRIWGGGIYEDDLFYDLCDQNGILIWHDLMFACAMYPADSAFLANVDQEIYQNVRRLRNHPSIALWCGNNENEISWYAWGWKEKFNPEQQAAYEKDLHKLFYQVIPAAIQAADGTRYYHPTSPNAGFNQVPYEDGDIHYWGVWHGQEPFENYQKHIGRFVSEYGFQSYPELATIEAFTLPEDRHLHSEVMLAHQRCMADERRDREYGNRLIKTYMDRAYRSPKDFNSYLYVSQVLQAEGVKTAIEAQRRARPKCMGSLYWQIDDCWPVASWSGIDYYGRWKALHYYARRAYANLLVSPVIENDSLNLYLVSDSLASVSAQLHVLAQDFSGKVVWEQRLPVEIAANSSRSYFGQSLSAIIADFDPRQTVLNARLYDQAGQKCLAENDLYFAPTKDLTLIPPQISHKIIATAAGYDIELASANLARHVYLTMAGADGFFSDNYFDLMPGATRIIHFRSDNKQMDDPETRLQIRTILDSY